VEGGPAALAMGQAIAVTVDATAPDPWRSDASVAVATEGVMTGQRPSRSLVAKHRLALPLRPRHHDAFIIDEPAECTVELDRRRSASNLDEVDLGAQGGAVA
jgi:hypothetical protein